MSVTAYSALGSNLGDRREYLERALGALRTHLSVSCVSAFYETAPVGGPPGQGPYLNAAAELKTALAPADLLRLLLEVEGTLGRTRAANDAPRTIDLDLLLYGDVVLTAPDLVLPHPPLHAPLSALQPFPHIA